MVNAAAGNAWAHFEALAAARSVELYRLAAAMVGTEDAADAVQDAFLDAWRHFGQLRDQGAADAWLRSIVINRCRLVLRARRRRVRTIHLDAANGMATTAALELSVEERDRLDRAFERLSADQRVVLALRYTVDLPVSAVAAACGVPEGTVKSRLNAAMARLRVALQENR